MNSIGQLTQNVASNRSFKEKVSDYVQLFKVRLTSLVIFSTFVGYIVASNELTNWWLLLPLVIGGFLTVASANSLNQIIERKTDRLMSRTLNRPVATERMSVQEALIASLLTGVAGVLLLGYFLNPLSALLALVGLMVYAFAYTPLKKINGISVWVGAVAGAIPPMVGIAAASGEITPFAWTLFVLQFFWQFPHFYAIAWVLDDDYQKAGLKLMPIGGAKNKNSALQIVLLTLVLIPSALIPAYFGITSWTAAALVSGAGVYMLQKGLKLLSTLGNKEAKALMFSSFIYLPFILIVYLIEFLIK